VQTITTDTGGNQQMVGPTADISTVTTNPVFVAGEDYTHNDVFGIGVAPSTHAVLTAPGVQGYTQAVGITGTACGASGTINGISQVLMVPITIQGSWTGAIVFNVSYVASPVYVAAMVYPLGTNGYPSGPAQSSITANGTYAFYGTGIWNYEVCGATITGGGAQVTTITESATNAQFVNQPVAANLHARTEPNNAPLSACTPVPINFSSSGNNTIVAGVGGQQVRIYA
jgi:hypothetical protein